MNYADDEEIPETPADSRSQAIAQGGILAKIPPSHKLNAPLIKCPFKVLLELTGAGTARHGLDLVMVLDISGSMKGEKLEKMKKAVQFVIKKLSPVDDRLSIVTFNGGSARKCPLLRIKDQQSQKKMEDLVNGLAAGGTTNIAAGLETGLQVLKARKQNGDKRVEAIMLMSDGLANPGCDGTGVKIGNESVHTFGFGPDHDSKALSAIARNGGTFSDVGELDEMTNAFSGCLAGLLSVAVRDLKLKISKRDSDGIKILSPLGYEVEPAEDKIEDSITILFGDLYIKEVRKILVELQLPDAEEGDREDVLKYTYSYSIDGVSDESRPRVVNIGRSKRAVETPECMEVVIEEKRAKAATMMTEAVGLANEGKLEDAREKLSDAISSLNDFAEDQSIKILIGELETIMSTMKTIEKFKKEGQAFALSSESSTNLQRFANRKKGENQLPFTTPLMEIFLKEAESFDKDPTMPLPKGDENLKQEVTDNPQKTPADQDEEQEPADNPQETPADQEPAANRLAVITKALQFCINYAIQFLQAIGNIVKRGR